jgi:hypothetical protein
MADPTKLPRERGTLQDTLPKPYLILFLFWIMCTATAVYIHNYSNVENVESNKGAVIISLQAGLGVASSMYSVVYSYPFVHLVSYTFDVSDIVSYSFHRECMYSLDLMHMTHDIFCKHSSSFLSFYLASAS